MIPKFRIFDKKKKRFLGDFTMEIDKFGIHVLDEFNYVVDEDDRVLMQSTGLTDVNGKEIFEGDVVKGKSDSFRLSCYGEVYWDKDFCRYRINDKKRNRQYEVDWRWKLQIIGNIHEHSGILKENGE